MTNKAYEYALSCVNGDIHAPKYVILQCKDFINICDGNSEKYVFHEKKFKKICKILKVLKMAKGSAAGETVYEALAGYQWLFIIAVLCVVYRDDKRIRRYQNVILEIARKNGKTFTIALLFLILFYLEPQYSKFYSVAPDGSLAREIKEALEPLITTNRAVIDEEEMVIRRDYILFTPLRTKYVPLNYSTNRMDGKEPNVFIADEVGALPNNYPVEAMRSGQLLVRNKLGFVVSTKYPTVDNPLEDEVANAKLVLDGLSQDETLFALLYEPDNPKDWVDDLEVLEHANPLAIEIPEVMEDLIKKRNEAITRLSKRENFLTKHCNIVYQGTGTESFVDVNDVRACRVDNIDWSGRDVYIGVDLSMSNDNCAVAMVADDNGTILSEVIGFVPEGRIPEKNKFEKIDYYKFIEACKCIACGDMIVDYEVIEDFVFQIEDKYGVRISAIGFDRYNAISSAQKWDRDFETIVIRQHSSVLHAPTKLLYEKIMKKEFAYTDNELLEINFQNSQCTFDTNMNRYVNKKKSKGKIDMVVALINAIFLLQQDMLEYMDFVVQM